MIRSDSMPSLSWNRTIADCSNLQTRVYEKIRFPRVRRAQTNGEDLRDRWHSALGRSIEGEEINPATLLIRVSRTAWLKTKVLTLQQNAVLYDYDAEADTRKRWPEMSALVSEELRTGNITPLC